MEEDQLFKTQTDFLKGYRHQKQQSDANSQMVKQGLPPLGVQNRRTSESFYKQ